MKLQEAVEYARERRCDDGCSGPALTLRSLFARWLGSRNAGELVWCDSQGEHLGGAIRACSAFLDGWEKYEPEPAPEPDAAHKINCYLYRGPARGGDKMILSEAAAYAEQRSRQEGGGAALQLGTHFARWGGLTKTLRWCDIRGHIRDSLDIVEVNAATLYGWEKVEPEDTAIEEFHKCCEELKALLGERLNALAEELNKTAEALREEARS